MSFKDAGKKEKRKKKLSNVDRLFFDVGKWQNQIQSLETLPGVSVGADAEGLRALQWWLQLPRRDSLD